MNKWIIKNSFTALIIYSFLIFIIQSCADFSADLGKNDNSSNLKIQIFSPTKNGTLMEGNNEIIYSITQPYSIRFLELYINDVFVRNIPPNNDGTQPKVDLKLDSTYIDKKINLYLIYYDTDGTSQKSNIITQVLVTNDSRIPFKPYNLFLLSLNDESVNISWKDSSRYVEKYELWRKVNLSGEYVLLQELTGKSNNTNDYNLDTAKIYFYKLRGYKSSGFSEFSSEVNTAGIIISGNIYPPTKLSANVYGISNVILNWIDNSDNENYFAVQRRDLDGGNFSRIAALSKNTTSYKDSGNGIVIGSSYEYRIIAYSNEDSAISNSLTVKITPQFLSPPTNLNATFNSSIRVVNLNWNSSDNNILYFDIERKNDLSTYTLLRRIPSGNNIYLDFSVDRNKFYTYRIRGYDLYRFSEYSNEVTISTF